MQSHHHELAPSQEVSTNGQGPAVEVTARQGTVYIDVTAFTGTDIDFDIEEYDPTSGDWFILASVTPSFTSTGKKKIELSVHGSFDTQPTPINAGTIRIVWDVTSATVTFSASFQGKEGDEN